jgi:hypothetical protein
MASVSTGGEQGFEAADGSGAGCLMSAAQLARPISLRPRQVVERRLFCVRCPWSAADTDDGAETLGGHLAGHGTTTADPGMDWALGHRYGPLDGRRRRGRVRVMPELERKAGPRRTAEQRVQASAAGGAGQRRAAKDRKAARGNAAGGSAVPASRG